MTALRRIDRIVTPPPVGPGFAGPRHTARLIVPPGDFAATNPFFLMADDYTKVGGEFGEAHPHAGLETVTFMLSGSFEDFEGRLDPGDVEWMTSGRGIVHGKGTVTSNDPLPSSGSGSGSAGAQTATSGSSNTGSAGSNAQTSTSSSTTAGAGEGGASNASTQTGSSSSASGSGASSQTSTSSSPHASA